MEDFEEAARVCGAGDCGEFELGGDVSGDGGGARVFIAGYP